MTKPAFLALLAAALPPVQIAIAVAAGVAASFVLLPDIVDASESSTQYHHLSHAAQFFVGAMIGAALGSSPAVFRRLRAALVERRARRRGAGSGPDAAADGAGRLSRFRGR